MDATEFTASITQITASIRNACERELPIKIGAAAEKHFKDNFRKSGFVNNGTQRWTPSKRIGTARGADGSRKTLLSRQNNLFNNTRHRTAPSQAIIYNDTPYAAVHNEGLRAGRGAGFTMPQRQFIGGSAELDNIVESIIDNVITKILNK